MKITFRDKLVAYLTLLTGLSISVVAIWYSVAGLVSIFAAAAMPIIIMGVVLEVSKLVATVWLKMNWKIAPVLIRTYLIVAIVTLMFITSIGIFGFLSKAHLDQTAPVGDVVAQVSIIDDKVLFERENIQTQKDNIAAARQTLSQLDSQVNETLARTKDATNTTAVNRSVNIRRQQAKERTALQKEIAVAQQEIEIINGRIAELNQQRAPIAAEIRAVEAEVGPIRYIAAMVYDNAADTDVLERAVRAVIIIIVAVFDPLAVVLLLASQYSFQYFRRVQEEETKPRDMSYYSDTKWTPEELKKSDEDAVVDDAYTSYKAFAQEMKNPEGWHQEWVPNSENPWMDVDPLTDEQLEQIKAESGIDQDMEMYNKYDFSDATIDPVSDPATSEGQLPDNYASTQTYLSNPWVWIDTTGTEGWVPNQELDQIEGQLGLEEQSIIDSAEIDEKIAMHRWKNEHPESSLKLQRKLFERGAIVELPWNQYLKAQPDLTGDSKKKDSRMDGDSKRTTGQEKPRDIGYVQNAEQGQETLWQRIKNSNQ